MLYCFIIPVFILTLNRKTKITLRQSDGKANQLVSVERGNDAMTIENIILFLMKFLIKIFN